MALDPQDLPSDKLARDVARLYRQAQRELTAQIDRALAAGRLDSARHRRLQLEAVVAFLDSIGRSIDPVARKAVEQAHIDGGQLALQDVKRLGASVSDLQESTFFSVNREATIAAQDALLGRLSVARETIGRQVDDIFRKQGLTETTRALLGVDGSPQKAARRLQRELAKQGQVAFVDKAGRQWKLADYSEMAVRTTTREAVVAGQVNRLAAHGINLVRVTTHADSCDICKPFEGRLIDLGGTVTQFHGEPVASGPLPPFHPRCVAPGTVVSGRGIYGGFRSQYRGDLVYLTTAGAVTVAVTPNHPVMTGAGWLPAGELRKGDYVFRATDERRFTRKDDLDHVPALVEDVFDSLLTSGSRSSVAAAGHDFHGDARNFEGEVDVVFADRGLLHKLAAKAAEMFGEHELVWPGVDERLLVTDSASIELRGAPLRTPGRCVSCGRRRRPDRDPVAREVLAHGALGHVRVDGKVVETFAREVADGVALDVRDGRLPAWRGLELLGSRSDVYAEALKLGSYAGRARAELAGAVREGRAAGVQLDELVEVDRRFYSGHVYDLSTIDGSYRANTVIVSNCAHTIMGVSEMVESIRSGRGPSA